MTFESVKKRHNEAVTNRRQWDPLLREIMRLAAPQSGDFWTDVNVAYNRYRYLHDNSLMTNLIESGGRVARELMPPGQTWARIVLGDTVELLPEAERDEANRQVDLLTRYLMKKIARTDFMESMELASICFQTFGYCAVMPIWDPIAQKVSWRNLPPQAFWIERGMSDMVYNVFWEVKMSLREAEARYGDYGRSMEKGEQITMQYASFAKLENGFLRSDVWIWDKDYDKKPVAFYDQPGMPIIVGAMKSMFGETYPVNASYGARWLPEAEMLNLMSADFKELVARQVFKPSIVSKDAFGSYPDGSIKLSPDSIYYADTEDVRQVATTLETGGDAASLSGVMDKSREAQRAEFGKLSTIANPEGPRNETAFAWWLAQQEQAGRGSSPKDQFKNKFLSPCIRQMLTELQVREGVISPSVELNGELFGIDIIGNGEAQENVNLVQKIRGLMEIGSFNPQEFGAIFKVDDAMRRIAESMGMTEFTYTPEQTRQIKQRMMQAIKEQAAGSLLPAGNPPQSQPGAGAQGTIQ